jgi:hypothetical protein
MSPRPRRAVGFKPEFFPAKNQIDRIGDGSARPTDRAAMAIRIRQVGRRAKGSARRAKQDLADRATGRSVQRPPKRLSDPTTWPLDDQTTRRPDDQTIRRPDDQTIRQPVGWPISRLDDHPSNRSIGQPISRLADWSRFGTTHCFLYVLFDYHSSSSDVVSTPQT